MGMTAAEKLKTTYLSDTEILSVTYETTGRVETPAKDSLNYLEVPTAIRPLNPYTGK